MITDAVDAYSPEVMTIQILEKQPSYQVGWVARLLAATIKGYQKAISPLMASRCRFYPSCSEYTREAIETHGASRGSWLAFRRLLRCHPWHPGGIDLVPKTEDK